jgi:hypothetical protein
VNTRTADGGARNRIRPNDVIGGSGRVGRNQVSLEVQGFNLRDAFAIAALIGWLTESVPVTSPQARFNLARQSYEIADAMIAARRGRRASK